jgi:hypothetical protein
VLKIASLPRSFGGNDGINFFDAAPFFAQPKIASLCQVNGFHRILVDVK